MFDFSEELSKKNCTADLDLEAISVSPFLEEEIKSTVWSCIGGKATALDGVLLQLLQRILEACKG